MGLTLESLKESYPWPKEPPLVSPNPHGWMNPENRDALKRFLSPQTRLVVELGSWMGLSARHILECAPNAVLACVDTWLGSPDHHHPRSEYRHLLPTLYETFLVNMWPHRERVIPIRADTLGGLRIVADQGLTPDLVYVDAGHDLWAVYADVKTTLDRFPETIIVGDDWGHQTVQDAARKAVQESNHGGRKRGLGALGNVWWSVAES